MPKDDWLKVAILYDKNARFTPSNNAAIDAFCDAAIYRNIYPTIIGKNDISTIPDFDGVFIRDTTHPGNYTHEFASYAEILGKKVIDSTLAISQGCNKIWQVETFKDHNISHPHTQFVNWKSPNFDCVIFPCVVKVPDSCFSQGVYKCNDQVQYKHLLHDLWFKLGFKNRILVCQDFLLTKFDWRITIFNHKFLFACKYYMADDDWKIVKYDRNGKYIEGNHECVRFEDIPPCVLLEAFKCDKFLTDGLYGIDIKQYNEKAYIIEINDNPSIDAGVEDEIEGSKIYDTIMASFRD